MGITFKYFVKVKTNLKILTNFLLKKIKKNCIIIFCNLLIYTILQAFMNMLKNKYHLLNTNKYLNMLDIHIRIQTI
jgi:hypothetical protein